MLLRKVFSILCFLTSVSFVIELDALKAGDEGVCVVKLSSPRTRVRYFTAYGKCNKKKCIVKKSKKEKYFVVTNQTVCCKGWEYSSAEEKCSPHCSTGCSGGRCVAPDTCQCEPPAQLDPEHGNTCITLCNPACHPPAVCRDNSCICDPGHPYNSTHCIPLCQAGFSNNPVSLICEPTCDPPCINGNCTAPNTCSCLDGHQLKEDGVTCKPTCERCVGRDCTDACTCKDGYVKRDGACVPSCASCENGRCVSPDTCECDAGFTWSGGICAPVCEGGCVNAECSAPGVCSCWEGFQRNETRPRQCYKPCADCGAACTSQGDCVQDEACQINDDEV